MNAFENYGTSAAPFPQRKADKPASALDKKMAERQRLNKAYRISKRKQRVELLEQEPRLKDFQRFLLRCGPEDGDELIEAVRTSWLPSASNDVKIFALGLVQRHSDRMCRRVGLLPMNDPLPPDQNVFLMIRGILSGGNML